MSGVQLDQLIDDIARIKIGSISGDQLENSLSLIEDKFNFPLDVTLSGDVITIEAAKKQKLESDGSNSTQNSYKWRLPTINGVEVDPAESTIELVDGITTGDFQNNPGTGKTVTASQYIKMGIELRQDGKFYVVWGTEGVSAAAATIPAFSKSTAIPIIVAVLQDSGGGGEWNFNTPIKSDIEIIKGGGGGGGGGGAGLIPVSETTTTLGVNVGKISYYAKEIELITALTAITADVSSDTTWYMYLDIELVAANGYTILDSHFFFSTNAPESGVVNLDKHLPRGKYTVSSSLIDLDSVEGYIDSTFGDFKGTMPLTEIDPLEITSATTGTRVHGLSGKPNQFFATYYTDATGKTVPIDPTNLFTDITSIDYDWDSGAYPFASNDVLTIYAQYILDTRTIVTTPKDNFESDWYSSPGPSTLAHDKVDRIKNYVVLEKTTSNGKIRKVDPSTIVDDFDSTNFNLDWSAVDFTDAEYKIIASVFNTLPASIPFNAEGLIVVDDSDGNFTTLWAALAVAVAGQKIIVRNNQTTSIQRIINIAVEIEFQPGVKVVCNTALASSVIQFNDKVVTKNFELELTHTSGTTTQGFELAGDESYHENIKLKMNGSGGTVTDAFNLKSGAELNFARGLTDQQDGTITNVLTDGSGVVTNDIQNRDKV